MPLKNFIRMTQEEKIKQVKNSTHGEPDYLRLKALKSKLNNKSYEEEHKFVMCSFKKILGQWVEAKKGYYMIEEKKYLANPENYRKVQYICDAG